MSRTVAHNDTVEIKYTLRLEDNSVVDSNDNGPLFKFAAGGDGVIPGISNGVIGMSAGEKRSITVPPAEGYGELMDELVVSVPRENLPEGVKIGDLLSDGQSPQPWRVTDLGLEKATLDGNHMLAGKTLYFEVEMVNIL